MIERYIQYVAVAYHYCSNLSEMEVSALRCGRSVRRQTSIDRSFAPDTVVSVPYLRYC